MANNDAIFNFQDDEGNNITETIYYENENVNDNEVKKEQYKFILLANKQIIDNLKNNQIIEFFFDCTYKCVPPTKPKMMLMVLCGYNNFSKKTVLCVFILLQNEKEFTFKKIFEYLRDKYSFNPPKIMCDFSLSQINACKSVFPNTLIHCCFFHFSQCIWNKFKKYNLCEKGSYKDNYTLLFNIQLMCFMKRENINRFFKELKKKYCGSKYKQFLQYFSSNWLGNRYPKKIWNYNDLLTEEDVLKKFHFTNNITENINRYLNYELKMSKCSSILFKKIILNIIAQFDTKNLNEDKKNRKSDLLKFYIEKNYDNCNILSNEEIESLKVIYEDINFKNINGSFGIADNQEIDYIEYGESSEDENDEMLY